MFMDWTTQNYKNDAILPKFYIEKQRIYLKQFSKRKKLKCLYYLIFKAYYEAAAIQTVLHCQC